MRNSTQSLRRQTTQTPTMQINYMPQQNPNYQHQQSTPEYYPSNQIHPAYTNNATPTQQEDDSCKKQCCACLKETAKVCLTLLLCLISLTIFLSIDVAMSALLNCYTNVSKTYHTFLPKHHLFGNYYYIKRSEECCSCIFTMAFAQIWSLIAFSETNLQTVFIGLMLGHQGYISFYQCKPCRSEYCGAIATGCHSALSRKYIDYDWFTGRASLVSLCSNDDMFC